MLSLGGIFDVDRKERRLEEVNREVENPALWDDPKRAQEISKEQKLLEDLVGSFKRLNAGITDAKELFNMAIADEDFDGAELVAEEVETFRHDVEKLEFKRMFNKPQDSANCYIEIQAGAGGTEAQDWTSMLLRMFTRYAERQGFAIEMLDYLPGDEAGVKSATLQINGHNAYGYLRSEKGVHRLVRISPFDANARRHTSFAAVDVMPELDDTVDIKIDPSDLKVDTYRASGAGGQHVNKTSSAVRMTHIPTGIIVQCQNERSQIQNRERCMQLLRAKLYEYERAKQEALKNDIAGDYQDIEWGSQIRSYVFQPYKMVKDHRTGAETGNVQAVMDGGLDMFIEAYLRSQQKKI